LVVVQEKLLEVDELLDALWDLSCEDKGTEDRVSKKERTKNG
jgi:hypothetical protein